MKRLALQVGILFLSLLLAACGAAATSTPVAATLAAVPGDTPAPTSTDSPAPTPRATATAKPSPTPVPPCNVAAFADHQRLLCAPPDVRDGHVTAEWLRWCLGNYGYALTQPVEDDLPLMLVLRADGLCTYSAILAGHVGLPYVNGVLFLPPAPRVVPIATFTPTPTPTRTATPSPTPTKTPKPTPAATPRSHEPLIPVPRPLRASRIFNQPQPLVSWYVGYGFIIFGVVESIDLAHDTAMVDLGGLRVKVIWLGDDAKDRWRIILIDAHTNLATYWPAATLGGDIQVGDTFGISVHALNTSTYDQATQFFLDQIVDGTLTLAGCFLLQ